ncbi:tRNA dimethylallyltransferase [Mucilaginibacter sp. PAMC 26640]|nr:tRNA dimethylallyltransferase [Mucilaginibacter sp. PAMC 26640]
MSTAPPTLIVIAGPTASGKTAAAIRVAQHLDTVIISADSRQFFREMSIGTAKPTPDELAAAPHYFINSHSVTESFSVGDFERECLALLDDLFKKKQVVILAGGSGLYIKAICEGFDNIPDANPAIRERLNNELAEKGIAPLQERLKTIDSAYYAEVDISNPQRVIRALEVYESSGQPFSSFRTAKTNQRPFNIVKIGLDLPREILYHRINQRVDLMLDEGLVEEVKSLTSYRTLNALNTVGYSEIFEYLNGKTDLADAVGLIKQNTRRFAKRQMTWFRKDKEIVWVDALGPNLLNQILTAVNEKAQLKKPG